MTRIGARDHFGRYQGVSRRASWRPRFKRRPTSSTSGMRGHLPPGSKIWLANPRMLQDHQHHRRRTFDRIHATKAEIENRKQSHPRESGHAAYSKLRTHESRRACGRRWFWRPQQGSGR